jgi:hypothetical protein
MKRHVREEERHHGKRSGLAHNAANVYVGDLIVPYRDVIIKKIILQIRTKSAPLSIIIIIISAQIRRAKQPLMWPQTLPLLHYMHGSLLLQEILTTGWAAAALCMQT